MELDKRIIKFYFLIRLKKLFTGKEKLKPHNILQKFYIYGSFEIHSFQIYMPFCIRYNLISENLFDVI
jgi:hypothetical protein